MENIDNENFESYEDFEEYENAKGKSAPKKVGGTAMLNIKITNNTGANQTIELFNPNASVALVNNPTISALNPFTAADVTAVNTNNLIFFNRAGNLVYDVAAGQMITSITNNGVTYKQLFESTKTMRFRITKCLFNPTAEAQLDNGINFFYKSTFGKQTNNEITPSNFRDPINPNAKLMKMTPLNWLIDCESGLSFVVNAAELVLTMTLHIDNIQRGAVWAK